MAIFFAFITANVPSPNDTCKDRSIFTFNDGKRYPSPHPSQPLPEKGRGLFAQTTRSGVLFGCAFAMLLLTEKFSLLMPLACDDSSG